MGVRRYLSFSCRRYGRLGTRACGSEVVRVAGESWVNVDINEAMRWRCWTLVAEWLGRSPNRLNVRMVDVPARRCGACGAVTSGRR